MSNVSVRPRWALAVAIGAIAFGALTLVSGGSALFGSAATRAAFGRVVPFVLWFNFLSGFVYVLVGVGLLLWRRWAAQLSVLLAAAILVVFAAFAWHVASGGAFETRTVIAMAFRSVVWLAIAAATCSTFRCFAAGTRNSGVSANGKTS